MSNDLAGSSESELLRDTIHQISSVNRAWKLAQDRWGTESPLSQILRDRKVRHQIFLLRNFANDIKLVPHTEEGNEPLYSIRLKQPVTLPNGVVRTDADHIPVRIIDEFLEFNLRNYLTDPASPPLTLNSNQVFQLC